MLLALIYISMQKIVRIYNLVQVVFSVPILRLKSRLSHVNVFLRHHGGQLKTAVEQEAGKKIDWKR